MNICRTLAEYHLSVLAAKRAERELGMHSQGLPATQALLLAVIDAHPGITCDQAVEFTGLDFAQVFTDCMSMVQREKPLVRIEAADCNFPERAFITDVGKKKLAKINASG